MLITLIHPANDAAALELSNWCTRIIPHLNEGLAVKTLYAGSANRASIPPALLNAHCVLFYGHGGDAELLGASGPIIDTENVGLAKGAILVAVACSSAKVLGPTAVSQGLRAYLGFRDRFVWVSRDPEGCFEAAINAGVHRVVRGDTMEEAVTTMRDGLGDVVEYYLNGQGRKSPNRALGWLAAFWDQQHLELHGRGSVSLRSGDKVTAGQ
jgi:hypothetical protein